MRVVGLITKESKTEKPQEENKAPVQTVKDDDVLEVKTPKSKKSK